MPIVRNNQFVDGLTMLDFPSTLGEVLEARATEAIVRSPLPSLLRLRESFRAGGRMLSAEEVFRRSREVGLDFNEPMPESRLEIFIERKQRELNRQRVVATGPQGLGVATLGLFVELATTVIDPINLASAFIPIVGQARYAVWAARFGKPLARAGRGFAEGLVGAALVEPLVLAAATQEQADYGFLDSMLNVTFGGVAGGGLHVGFGKLGDIRKARKVKRVRLLDELIERTDKNKTQIPAMRAAISNVANDGVMPNPDLFLREDAAFREGVEPRIDSDIPGEERLRVKSQNAEAIVENVPEKLQAEIDRIEDPANSLLGGVEDAAREDLRMDEINARREDSSAAEETMVDAEEDLKGAVRALMEDASDEQLDVLGITRDFDAFVEVRKANQNIADVREQEEAVRALVACMKRGGI